MEGSAWELARHHHGVHMVWASCMRDMCMGFARARMCVCMRARARYGDGTQWVVWGLASYLFKVLVQAVHQGPEQVQAAHDCATWASTRARADSRQADRHGCTHYTSQLDAGAVYTHIHVQVHDRVHAACVRACRAHLRACASPT